MYKLILARSSALGVFGCFIHLFWHAIIIHMQILRRCLLTAVVSERIAVLRARDGFENTNLYVMLYAFYRPFLSHAHVRIITLRVFAEGFWNQNVFLKKILRIDPYGELNSVVYSLFFFFYFLYIFSFRVYVSHTSIPFYQLFSTE